MVLSRFLCPGTYLIGRRADERGLGICGLDLHWDGSFQAGPGVVVQVQAPRVAIRESSNSANKEIAQRRERRRKLELGASGLQEKAWSRFTSSMAELYAVSN